MFWVKMFKKKNKKTKAGRLPGVWLFQNKKNGKIIIAKLCQDPDMGLKTVSQASPIIIEPKNYYSDIYQAIFEAFESFSSNPYGMPDFLKKDENKFYRNHRFVSIWFDKPDEIHVAPMTKIYGGHQGDPEDLRIYTLEEFKENLPQIILEAFERCK